MKDAYGEEWNKELECDYCHHLFKIKARQGITYKGIDEHHNPPQFMLDNWEGEVYYLCREHHRKLHDEIIKIMNRIAETLKFVNSEHWVWVKMNKLKQNECVREVYNFTKRWIRED